jgi:dTDP-4-dehydrorhamnose reductase
MSRILITGGSGDLGRPLSALAARNHEVASTFFSNPKIGGGRGHQVDLVDRDATLRMVRDFRPDAIIHTAMSDRSTADDLIKAANNLIEAAESVDARLVVMSTDMVFDGKKPPYAESDPPTPVSEYGRAK